MWSIEAIQIKLKLQKVLTIFMIEQMVSHLVLHVAILSNFKIDEWMHQSN